MYGIKPYVIGTFQRLVEHCGEWWCCFVFTQWQNCIVNIDKAIGGAGNGTTANPHDIVFGIYAPDTQTLGNAPSVAHVTGKFGTRPNTALFTATTNVTGTAMGFGHTMRGRHTLEAVTFNHALETMIDTTRIKKCQCIKSKISFDDTHVFPLTST